MPLVAGASVEFDMRAGTTIASNRLTDWVDQVGGSRTLTVPATFEGPVTNAVTLDGNAVASFDGSNDVLQLTDGTYVRGKTTHILLKAPNAGNWNIVMDAQSGNYGKAAVLEDDLAFGIDGGNATGDVTGRPVDTWFVLTMVFDNSTGNEQIWFDDVRQLNADVIASLVGFTGITVGARAGLGFGFAEFDVAHIVEYQSVLSDANIESNISFLQAEWGLAAPSVSTGRNSLVAMKRRMIK